VRVRAMSGFRTVSLVSLAAAFACSSPPPQVPVGPAPVPQAEIQEDAVAFVKRFNEEGERIGLESGKAAWVQQTYITDDTTWLMAKARERYIIFRNEMIEQAKRYDVSDSSGVDGDTRRALKIIKQAVTMPAPNDKAKVAELATLSSELKANYGAGKYCKGAQKGDECRDIEALMEVMAKSHDYDELLDVWKGWRTIAPRTRDAYTKFAELMNEGARELGFADTGALWKSGYDMSADEFETEADRLWQQVKPLYDHLHCYVRAKLGEHYGADKVPATGPIPAHLLGNMWAQEWSNIFELVKPYEVELNLDITAALVDQGYDALRMVKSAEAFYTSMGLTALPESFWEKSMLTKPRDRDVMCHASAWDLDLKKGDVRIKMCTDPNEEDLTTVYHELGHIYYYLYYKDLPLVFQDGAHDGFHEAIGDALTLSMTPGFYKKIGLIGEFEIDEKALINQQLKEALDKIAFLPFGKLIDQWRWDVFSGKTKPDQYNAAWWALRLRYQGIAPGVARSEADFDPGAKFHIPNNTPYTRYFLARILQFQFHKSMCDAAGFKGPVHECSIHGSKVAGDKLSKMLAMGASRPWPEAMTALTGSPQMDASAIIAYFAPLMKWLEQENAGRQCGW
ncbi:M2 family metallopeptidase, partial [Desulfobulbus sp. AH-315-M07]|nr:M2 family metallopeptidase [Desulfobulbus sp. AH-315-M07]